MDFLFSNLARDDYPDHRAQKVVATLQRIYSSEFIGLTQATPLELHYVQDHKLADNEAGLVFDPRDDDSYLGEHHLETVPRAVVLLGACKKYGENPDETTGHEVFETGMDPSGRLCVEIDDQGTEEAWEAADAVQGSSKEVDGVTIPNFVIPNAYFCEVGTQYDWLGVLKAPHTKTPGGYRLIKRPGEQWSQDEGEKIATHKKLGIVKHWSRRGKRVKRHDRAVEAILKSVFLVGR